jgi:alcohol dehydrogenase (cytochrome c)
VTRYLFIGAVDWCAVYKSAPPKYAPPQLYLGTSLYPAASEPKSGWITALDATSGRVVWRYHASAPVVSGVTATAGGLVFGGDLNGNLLAFDSREGKVLLQTNLGGPLAGGVITYSTGGHQFVAATAGNLSRGVFQTVGTPRVVVLTTGLAPGREPEKLAVARPTATEGSDEQEGKGIFVRVCSACHGTVGEGGPAGPPLMYERDRKSLDQIIALIKAPRAPMPQLFPKLLDDNDVRRVAAYVRTLP